MWFASINILRNQRIFLGAHTAYLLHRKSKVDYKTSTLYSDIPKYLCYAKHVSLRNSKEMKVHQNNLNWYHSMVNHSLKTNPLPLSLYFVSLSLCLFSKILRQIFMRSGLGINSAVILILSFPRLPSQKHTSSVSSSQKKRKKNEIFILTGPSKQSPGRLPYQFIRHSLDISESLLRLM